jgi:nucleoside-diphosphate-sugar epimerase
LDAASAFQAIVEGDPSSKIINVGNPTTQKIRDLALMVGREIGATELIKFGAIAYRDDQVMELRPDVGTLSQLNWRPKIQIQEGIRSLISEFSGGSVNQQAQVQNYLKV